MPWFKIGGGLILCAPTPYLVITGGPEITAGKGFGMHCSGSRLAWPTLVFALDDDGVSCPCGAGGRLRFREGRCHWWPHMLACEMAGAGSSGSTITAGRLLELLGSPRQHVRLSERHRLLLDGADRSPWFSLVSEGVRRDYPVATEEELLSLTSILCKAYAESTELAYVGRLRDFAQFSLQHVPPLPGLPCEKHHVHLYLLHLA